MELLSSKIIKIAKITMLSLLVMLRNLVVLAGLLILAVFVIGKNLPAPEDPVLSSLGSYEDRDFFSYGIFQDYTDYAKYYYTSAEISENEYFSKIQEWDFHEISRYLNDFETWIPPLESAEELAVNYDFDRNIIDTEDYFYIKSKNHTFTSYNIYLFDTQTQTLYFFHNNI